MLFPRFRWGLLRWMKDLRDGCIGQPVTARHERLWDARKVEAGCDDWLIRWSFGQNAPSQQAPTEPVPHLPAAADPQSRARVPGRVPAYPDARQIDRLDALASEYGVTVGPPILDHRWLPRRQHRTTLSSVKEPGERVAAAVGQFAAVVDAIKEHAV